MTQDKRFSEDVKGQTKVFRSQELANIAGTTPRALRHYHNIGLLPEVQRDANGYRRYGVRDLVTVLRIRQLAKSGMPLRDISDVLEHDAQHQDAMLAVLDEELAAQQERIEVQRKLLSELRDTIAKPVWVSSASRPTATEQFDRDVWTLVSATPRVDAQSVATIRKVLNERAVLEAAGAWYPQFERLEAQTHIDDELADRLAMRMVDFVTMLKNTDLGTMALSSANQELPIMGLIENLRIDAFSLAQHKVWSRFLAFLDN